jgi:hypothetical protein
MPQSARGDDAEAAEAFARYWFDLLEYAYLTGRTGPLLDLAQENCSACKSFSREINDAYAAGGHFEGVDIEVRSVVAAPPDDRGTIVATVLDEAPSRIVSADGTSVDESPAANGSGVDVYLSRTATGWKVFDLGKVQ